ncbi:hypothetical protein J4730_14025 [Klebsiella pneumoniae]|uniref:Uncharacterized protein n=1 Tax=Klebsiella pneumoniae TaxID=573 RepID=A0A939NIF2_KLEPN|nr:hypothetical protein [Klebsiella pneumoniae]
MSIVILWALALLVLQPALAAEPRQQPTAREQYARSRFSTNLSSCCRPPLARPRPKSAFCAP